MWNQTIEQAILSYTEHRGVDLMVDVDEKDRKKWQANRERWKKIVDPDAPYDIEELV